MGKNIMDTQDLSEIRKLLGDAPDPPETGGFDLDSIIAEVGGTVKDIEQGKQRRVEHVRPTPRFDPPARETPAPRAQAPAEKPAEEAARARFRVVDTQPEAGERVIETERRAEEAVRQASAPAPARRAASEEEPRPVRRMLPPEDDWDDEDEGESRREEKRRRKAEAQAAKAARRARTQEEDDEETYEARDPRVAQGSCARRARGLAGRSVPVLLLFLATTYLTLAGGMGWPVPDVLVYAENTVLCVLTLLVCQFVAMLIGVDIIGGGLYALFTGAPDRKTLVSFACLASLLHGVTIIVKPEWGGLLPYCAVSILLLFAAMQEEKARYSGRQRAFKAALMATRPTGVYCHRDEKTDTRAAVKTDMPSARDFLVELEKPDTAQRFAAVYTPVMLAASIIFALVVSLAQGVPSRFFWALSAMLSMSAPIGVICAAGPAYAGVSRRLLTEGAAIVGARSAGALRRARQAVLTDSDLFPAGSITIDGVRNYGSYSAEKLLSYAAAVTSGQGLEIGRVFSESLREQYGRPVKAANVLQYESGGLSADIGGDSVLVGTAAFLMKLHVRIRDIHGVENGVFVVINNQVAGVFVLTYHPSAPSYSALQAFRRMHKKPVLATRDFNITPAMVESLFELRSGTTEAAPDAAELNDPGYTRRDTVCGILTHDGASSFAQLLHSAEKLSAAVRTNLGLGAFSGVCGLLLVFYLANLFAVDALQPKNLIVYLLLWYVPAFLMTLGTRRKY